MIYDAQKSSHSVQDITDIGLEKQQQQQKKQVKISLRKWGKKGLDAWEALWAYLRDERNDFI